MLRYQSTGELHKDFHGLTCATLHYLLDNYGESAVTEVMTGTAQQVYKSIHEKLKNGDTSELKEFWEYYFSRENGVFSIEETAAELRLTVQDCPALRHLVKLEQQPDRIMCRATGIFNQALCENSPFSAILETTGDFSCCQILKRKDEI